MKTQQMLHYGLLRILMQKNMQRVLLRFGHDLHPDKWIFILGCYNSATTLLATLLSKHPLVGGLPNEGSFLTDVLPYPETFGWPRMWIQCLDKMRVEIDSTGISRARRIKRQWSMLFPKGVSNLVEKSVANIVRTPFLQEYFSPAYFIYIIRNGYVVSKGIQQKANYARWRCPFAEGGYPIELCADQWKTSDEIMETNSKFLKKIMYIRYEDLTTTPRAELQRITDFLELPSIPSNILHEKLKIHEINSSITNMNSLGIQRLSRDDFERIESVAGNILKKYGYTREG